jgi:putative glutamine amidotransferase
MSGKKPIIGIPCDVTTNGLHPFHGAGEKYINAVANGSDALPLLIPALFPGTDLAAETEFPLKQILHTVDGLLLPGNPSNIEPHHYGASASETPDDHDPQRDSTSLSLIRAAAQINMPILGICRGFQEMNVAFGGTLHQKVHELSGMMDHRENKALNRDGQYAEAHPVTLVENGILHAIAGVSELEVNSLHGQGADQLGETLTPEAHAPDGLVEAFSSNRAGSFIVGIQWHPEWRFNESAFAKALFQRFGEAAMQYHKNKARQ